MTSWKSEFKLLATLEIYLNNMEEVFEELKIGCYKQVYSFKITLQ